jgi:hypothetical protein
MNNITNYIGQIIDSQYRLSSDKGKLSVKIIECNEITKDIKLQVISTTPWTSSLGLIQDLIIDMKYECRVDKNFDGNLDEWWIPKDIKIPWMILQFVKNETLIFEHYR